MSPKIKLPLGSQSAKKSIGRILTFYDRGGKQCIKRYAAPPRLKEITLKQWTRRHIAGLLTAHWQCMTTVQKAVYDDAAKLKKLTMSGYNYFFKLAMADLYTHHGLCGYWSMNESTGAQVTDYSGQGNHGTLGPTYPSDCPTRVSAMIKEYGNALDFNGDNDYVDTGITFQSVFQDSFTLSFWIKISDGRPPSPEVFFGSLSSDINNGVYFYHTTAGDVSFWYRSDSKYVRVQTSPFFMNGPLPWIHFTLVADNFLSKAFLYINGYKNNEEPTGDLIFNDFNIVPNFYIGARGRNGSIDNYFTGIIDEFRIYNRALSSTEVFKQFNLLQLGKQRQAPLLH